MNSTKLLSIFNSLFARVLTLVVCSASSIALQAQVFSDNFNVSQDYLNNGVAGSIWDGFFYNINGGSCVVYAANANITNAGTLTLSTANGYWNATDSGVLLYKNVTNDFDASVQIVSANNVQFHDMGLMARQAGQAAANENFVLTRYFINGARNSSRNMVNGSFVNYDQTGIQPWIRLTRVGNVFTTYRSTDGTNWSQMSSFTRTDLAGIPVQVGLWNATFSANTGTAQFDNYKLILPVATTLALGSSANPSAQGNSVTFTATVKTNGVTADDAGGTMTFLDGVTSLGAISVTNGTASLSTSSLLPGAHTITAQYGGYNAYVASTNSLTQTVTSSLPATTTTLASSVNPSILSSNVAFTATIKTNGVTAGNATGTVIFSNDGTPVSTNTVTGGVATFNTGSLTLGSHIVTTAYNGDVNYAGNASGSVTQVVELATSAALVVTPNPAAVGRNVGLALTVQTNGALASLAGGSVVFYDGATPLSTNAVTSGQALYQSYSFATGSHVFSAQYLGDGTYFSSASSNVMAYVSPAGQTLSDDFSVPQDYLGGGVSGSIWDGFVYNVNGGNCTVYYADANYTTPGQLTFSSINGAWQGGGTTNNDNGMLLYKDISGDFDVSVQVASAQNVNFHDMGLMARQSGAPTNAENFVAVRYFTTGNYNSTRNVVNSSMVNTDASGAPQPWVRLTRAGNVFTTYRSTDGTNWSQISVVTRNDLADIPLQVGIWEATFSANAAIATFANFSLWQTTPTTTTLSSSGNPSIQGNNATFTATVKTNGVTVGNAAGTMTFLDGAISLGTVNVTNGIASLSTSSLLPGSHTIIARYNGDGGYGYSTNSLVQIVTSPLPATTTILVSSGNPSALGGNVTFTATVKTNGVTAGNATGTVIFSNNGTPISTNVVTSGVATFNTISLALGSHIIATAYSGDVNYAGNASGSVTQVVELATSATLVVTPNPAAVGRNVGLALTVQTNGVLAGLAGGSVVFYDGATPLSTNAVTSGQAQYQSSSFAAGSHAFSAQYLGDGTYYSSVSSNVVVYISPAGQAINDDFSVAHDYLGSGVAGSIWDGFIYNANGGNCTVYYADANLTTPNQLTFSSVWGAWQGGGTMTNDDGMLLYRNVSGDFDVSVQVSSANNVQFHDMGLMARQGGQPATAENFVAARYFISGGNNGTRNVTNSVMTNLNVSGIQPWLRMTRVGNLFTTYRSTDGVSWSPMPAVVRDDLAGLPVQVGIWEATFFTGNTGTATFSNFQLWQPTPTTTTLASSGNPSAQGNSITFTATVKTNGVTAGNSAGTVTFLDGVTSLGVANVTNGIAALTTSSLLAGSHTIIAQYNGDGGYGTSTNSLSQQVNVVTSPTLQYNVAGGLLTISWPGYLGWTLQQQTNNLNVGLTTNWVDVLGTASVTTTNLPLNLAPSVFYRLRQ